MKNYQIKINSINNMDCLEGLKLLNNNSIDMVLTSPPYDNLRDYKNNIISKWNDNIWKEVIKELYRVIKQNSVVVWVVGDATINGSETGTSFKQALYAKEIGFNLHDTMIYQKENPIPQFKSHRYTNSFEYMFIFSKGTPNKGKLIEIPTKCAGRVDLNYRGQVTADEIYVGKSKKVIKETKLKSNIWIYSQNNGIDRTINHKAQFPEKLAEDHILSWSNENDIILDPFMGSGTTAKMALLNNRNFIGFEISEEYCNISKERILIL
ncbi:DNA-methyltransferase [Campylobacter lari]|uniref:DNA-methyltransferase n=2 Tax=Campylobacter lari TaxID=201 RepID=UPI0021499EED|nr:site-specific DNA-methyltransferase [Campylobacter lari]MCR2068972.1 site-specific DNA-methyltransferase [Campylobacter lari subsp. concheus]MCR2073081.1 site-specific DNA-methyltransferase [Campylobacter lari subsp. concheus]